ncbi:tRNA-splicing endonuclease [Nitzschia inconspicua]|uniref:tRNA-splicing endonuclease n=1 Tax=Nitzschia inconspicua TaxID=303405 RepID=A0A9K3M6C0_9STRA|nr:tRNA-splicing endonuclease [Nitzschia inconspicua]
MDMLSESKDGTIQNVTNDTTPPTTDKPIICVLDPSHNMFRVTRAKGKALASGGFGVTIRMEEEKDDNDEEEVTEEEVIEVENGMEQHTTQPSSLKSNAHANPSIFLFIEEALFLHERGLLQATMYQPSGESADPTILDTSQLHQLLPAMGMSLAMYLIFSHLRSQEFRVLRHDPQRFDILRRQIEHGLSKLESNRLRRQVRESIQHAAIPTIPMGDEHSFTIQLCWDCYQPNCQFAKTRPGLPDFYVAATYYSIPLVQFTELQQLVQDKCHGIPLKVATVSDSGTVVMFGVSEYGVPAIHDNIHDNNGEETLKAPGTEVIEPMMRSTK